jgi:DNA modification methylase
MNYEILDKWIGISPEYTLQRILHNTKVTFSDNMDVPIHRWFRFPAGFSAELAELFLKLFSSKNSVVLDPFTGCGTTNVVAKALGLPSIGIERHPLLAWIARVKTRDYNLNELHTAIENLLEKVRKEIETLDESRFDIDMKPELLHKCYPRRVLCELYAVKECVESIYKDELRDLFMLALICILRKVTSVEVGWPYILPKSKRRMPQPVYDALKEQLVMMWKDLKQVNYTNARVDIYEADARDLSFIDSNSIDVAFTSPPYLNNYDYADRTRLELYFLGWASTWREITEKIRSKLIVSCSHQAKEVGLKEGLMPDSEMDSEVRENLIQASKQLRAIKRERGGKKDYDIMIVAYFNDMLKTMREMYRVLREGAYYGMVVGDSAPYGVYIATDEYLAKIGRGVGFRDAKIFILRGRGSKWKYLVDKKIRHNVQLRESLILFKK